MTRTLRLAMAMAIPLTAACAARSTPSTVDPSAAARYVDASAPDRPLRIIFAWTALDGDARFTGRGAARVEPPYHARLDLFGPRGETYVSAAVVDDDLRLPGGKAPLALPPVAMMWATLGVVAPPAEAVLVGTREEGTEVELHYDVGESRLRYSLADGRLRTVQWDGPGRRMAVQLDGSAQHGLPEEAAFRDWSGGTELMLKLEQVDEVESYPPEIWFPDG
jgi:hypothetical protein